MVQHLKGPLNWITMTSGEGNVICCQELVLKDLDISVTAHDVKFDEENQVVGYMA